MGKLVIPGNGEQPPSIRTINEIVEIDSRGNEKSRRSFYGTMILAKVDGKRQLVRYIQPYRLEQSWHKTACMVMFGIWISEMIHFFR